MSTSYVRTAYRLANSVNALASLAAPRSRRVTRVFFGGARSGDGGGPLVKARLLKQHFPDTRLGFSLVYLLSNALYLPQPVISAIAARGFPIVLNQNGVFYPAWHPEGWEQENARMAGAYHKASHILWQSDFCRRCANTFLGNRSGTGEVLFNATDTDRFVPRPGPARREPFTLLITGKIGKATAYRLRSSIEGVATARKGGLEVLLTIAGEIAADVELEMRATAASLGVAESVTFTGPYSASEAPTIYQTADAYLMMKHNDPCPNVVVEAMASGLPVLYSASGGVPELVGPEAGVGLPVEESFERSFAPAGDLVAEGLARIIAGRERMGLAARKRAVDKFELRSWITRHGLVFDQLVRNGSVTK